MMHLDTSFLVDLLREHARRQPGRATSFLEENAREHLRVGIHAVCELYAGVELARESAAERRRVRRLCAALDIA
jgi:tRNA(fMet)-specific endonuclease VapC